MKILITGASGLVGNQLKTFLTNRGHQIFIMKRGTFPDEKFYWNPSEDIIFWDENTEIDVVINLSGENLANKRWTKKQKQLIYSSRINSTTLLVSKLTELKIKPSLFISASAVGFYGNRQAEILDESSSKGNGFLADLCTDWEIVSKVKNIRTINLRLGIVLTPHGGMLKKILLPFRFGLGARLGNGNQYMSWIGGYDLCRVIEFIISNDNLTGTVNAVTPNPMTNHEFTKALSKQLKRPAIFILPGFLIKLIFGEMASEMLLASNRVLPKVLLNAGFQFHQTNISKIFKSDQYFT